MGVHEDPHFGSFMQRIMQLSLKNKQLLEIGSPQKPEHSLPRLDSKGKLRSVRADRLYLHSEEPAAKHMKNEEEPMAR
jgi:hypothetical protein